MTDRDQPISPLRQRMIEDMTIRGFTACTQRGGHLGGQELHGFSGPLAGSVGQGGFAPLPASHAL